MASALIRKLFRGWSRGESYWDTPGMNENLRTLGDHLPLNVKYMGPKPASAAEGECWINLETGEYSVWSTGPGLQAPQWNNYPAAEGLLAFSPMNGKMYGNTGTAWVNPISDSDALDAFD